MTALVDLPAEHMVARVDTLFPTYEVRDDGELVSQGNESVALFMRDELEGAANTLKNRKASGVDGAPVVKVIVREAHIFAEGWKIQRLALVEKEKKYTSAAFLYHPLCMLDTASKLLEKLIIPRLLEAVAVAG